ncbi:MAG: hypothetical protein GX221_04230 [Candidatus Riflebacteria bacterium]|nr:hypothetical protein [Candidatus Riflebacteria bacterium]
MRVTKLHLLTFFFLFFFSIIAGHAQSGTLLPEKGAQIGNENSSSDTVKSKASSKVVWLVVVVVLMIVATISMITEALVPGFGVFGITSILAYSAAFVIASLTLSWAAAGLVLILSLLGVGAFAFYFFVLFPKTKVGQKIILGDSHIAEGQSAIPDYTYLIGKEGKTITVLKPTGTAMIDGKRTTVLARGMFVEPNVNVVVTGVQGVDVLVKPLEEE